MRREFVRRGLIAAAAAGGTAIPGSSAAAGSPIASDQRTDGATLVVMASLLFPPEGEARASVALAELAAATRAEPGCLRYVVGRDPERPGLFHLSEIWTDLAALALHFRTPHMAAFSATARRLGYSAPFMKRIQVAAIADLEPASLAPEAPRAPR